jgi:hypothetical protein
MPNGDGNYLDEASPQNPQVAPVAQAQPQQAKPAVTPTQARHSMIGKIFETLAGGARTETAIDPSTGATIERKVTLKPGEMARNILASALTGMIAGGAERGPGSASRAFSKGGTAAIAQKEKQQQDRREQAQQEFKNRQLADEATLRKHADARLELEHIDRIKESGLRIQALQLGLKDEQYNQAKKHADDMIQYYAEAELIKSLGGKPVEGYEGVTDEDFFKGSGANIHGSVPGSFGGIPVRDPGTGTITVYEIPDKDKPLSSEEVSKANSLLGIDLKPGVNTRSELMSYFLRPQNAELITKRQKEAFEIKEAELKVEEAKERIKYTQAETEKVKAGEARERAKTTKESAKEKEQKEIEGTITDLAAGKDVPKGKRDRAALTVYAMVSKAHTALKDAQKTYTDASTEEAKAAAKDDLDAQQQQMDYWNGLQNQLHGVTKEDNTESNTLYGPNGQITTLPADKLDAAIAKAKALGQTWSKEKPKGTIILISTQDGSKNATKPEEVEATLAGPYKVAPESQAEYDAWVKKNKPAKPEAVGAYQK